MRNEKGRFVKGHKNSDVDLLGQRFGRLVVTRHAEPYFVRTQGYMRPMWACLCDCGNQSRASTSTLRGSRNSKGVQSCGCLQKEKAAEIATARTGIPSKRLIDLVGLRIGKLTVISKAGTRRSKSGKATGIAWNVICDCGTIKTAPGSDLRMAKISSCGHGECRAQTKPSGMAMARAVYAVYRCNARSRKNRTSEKKVFEITFEEFLKITKQDCTYCGVPPSTKAERIGKMNGAFIYNGIDRIDNNLGYTQDNVTACCSICNLMKRNIPVKDFIDHCRRISDYNNTHLTMVI